MLNATLTDDAHSTLTTHRSPHYVFSLPLTSRVSDPHVAGAGNQSATPQAGAAITPALRSSTLLVQPPGIRLPSAMFASPSSSVTVEYQPTSDRFPAALLWLPYAALTLLLSALLVASFVHFHCKNGHKYKKRRSTNGNGFDDETGSTSTVRHVAFSDNQTSVPGVAVIDCTSSVTCFRYTSPPSGRQRQQLPAVGWVDDNDYRLRKCNGDIRTDERPKNHQTKERSGRNNNRLSVEFVANRNGSMVNMRCAVGSSPTPTTSEDTKRDEAVSSTLSRPRPTRASRPSTARVAPVKTSLCPSALQGRRQEKPDVQVDWPNGPLYSALRICKMDDTVDDWNRLLDQSKL